MMVMWPLVSSSASSTSSTPMQLCWRMATSKSARLTSSRRSTLSKSLPLRAITTGSPSISRSMRRLRAVIQSTP